MNNYRSVQEPETVQLVFTSKDGKSRVKKSFMLDSGRLQLEPIKQTFGVRTVELILGK